jgi:hypothetical protein
MQGSLFSFVNVSKVLSSSLTGSFLIVRRNNMNSFDELQTEVYSKVGQERVVRRGQAAMVVASLLPQMRTVEDLEELEMQGYDVRSSFGDLNPRRLEADRTRLGFVNRALTREAETLLVSMPAAEVQSACIGSSRLALELLLQPPKGIEVCSRNPKTELAQLAKLLVQSKFCDRPVPFMVPCCPDMDQYCLGDGLGEIVPKGLDYCEKIQQLFAKRGFTACFDVQVADVEGLDPVILDRTGETTESHFAKTGETIHKAQQEVAKRGLEDVVVRSMQSAFTEAGMEYGATQAIAVKRIGASQERKVNKTIDGLLTERVKLGNFDRFNDDARRELVVAELAGYAAYGAMVGARAVILSPDAMSAIPAYHYSLNAPEQCSPVLYAR